MLKIFLLAQEYLMNNEKKYFKIFGIEQTKTQNEIILMLIENI
jgi:hypothetical protein